MEKEKFDQGKYRTNWDKENMAQFNSKYKKEFIEEYNEALKKLGRKRSDDIRSRMLQTIEEAKQEQGGE